MKRKFQIVWCSNLLCTVISFILYEYRKKINFCFSLSWNKCPYRRKENTFRHFSWTKTADMNEEHMHEIVCVCLWVDSNTRYFFCHNPILPLSVYSVQITAFWWDIKLTSSQWTFLQPLSTLIISSNQTQLFMTFTKVNSMSLLNSTSRVDKNNSETFCLLAKGK